MYAKSVWFFSYEKYSTSVINAYTGHCGFFYYLSVIDFTNFYLYLDKNVKGVSKNTITCSAVMHSLRENSITIITCNVAHDNSLVV